MTHKQIVFRYYRYYGKLINAKRDLPYEIKMTSRLLLDALCFEWDKKTLMDAIDDALQANNEAAFKQLSEHYRQFIWE